MNDVNNDVKNLNKTSTKNENEYNIINKNDEQKTLSNVNSKDVIKGLMKKEKINVKKSNKSYLNNIDSNTNHLKTQKNNKNNVVSKMILYSNLPKKVIFKKENSSNEKKDKIQINKYNSLQTETDKIWNKVFNERNNMSNFKEMRLELKSNLLINDLNKENNLKTDYSNALVDIKENSGLNKCNESKYNSRDFSVYNYLNNSKEVNNIIRNENKESKENFLISNESNFMKYSKSNINGLFNLTTTFLSIDNFYDKKSSKFCPIIDRKLNFIKSGNIPKNEILSKVSFSNFNNKNKFNEIVQNNKVYKVKNDVVIDKIELTSKNITPIYKPSWENYDKFKLKDFMIFLDNKKQSFMFK